MNCEEMEATSEVKHNVVRMEMHSACLFLHSSSSRPHACVFNHAMDLPQDAKMLSHHVLKYSRDMRGIFVAATATATAAATTTLKPLHFL
jgi:hypothetical protein